MSQSGGGGYSSSVMMGTSDGKMTVTVNGKTVIIDKQLKLRAMSWVV